MTIFKYNWRRAQIMIKRVMIVCVVLLMSLGLSSCKSSDYKEADSLYRSKKYLDAAKIFNTLGDYKDSKERLSRCIETHLEPVLEDKNHMRYNKYADAISILDSYNEITDCSDRIANLMDDCVDEYLLRRKYDDAISIMENHSSVADYSDRLAEVKQKKEYFKYYQQAISYFEKGKYEEGFEALKGVPDDFEYAGLMRSSYKGMDNCPFKGTHTYKSYSLGASQAVTFNTEYHNECFALHIHKEVYYSDGSIFEQKDFYPALSSIENNSIWVFEYTWTIDEYGRLVETEKGHTCVYDN